MHTKRKQHALPLTGLKALSMDNHIVSFVGNTHCETEVPSWRNYREKAII